MTQTLADIMGAIRFQSTSGRTELTTDPDGYRLHVTTGTDLLDADDVHRLLLTLAEDRVQEAVLYAATHVADTVDPYPYLLPLEVDEDERYCQACFRTVRGPLYPWFTADGAEGRTLQIGPGCFRKRLRAIRHRRDVRSVQMALQTGGES